MSIPLFTNNAKSPLASGISALPATGSIAISLTPGTGVLFPSPTAGYYFPVTLTTSAGQREIFYVTSRSVDTLTATRAQEGTIALAFNSGDIVSLRLTAGAISDLIMSTTVDFAVPLNTVAGVDTITALFTAPATTLVANTMYYFFPAGANTGAVTLNISATGAKAVTLDGTTPLTAGAISGASKLTRVIYDGVVFQLLDPSLIVISTFMETVLDDTTAVAARTTLGAVGLTGSEAVAGVKTFGSLPVLPSSTPTGQQAASASAAFRKNGLINGDFNVWQRGTSFAAVASGDYSADRWRYGKTSAAVHTMARSSDVPVIATAGRQYNYSLLVDCTTADAAVAAGDQVHIAQFIEGFNWLPFANRVVTLSFLVKATKIGVYCVSLSNSGLDRSIVAEYTVNVTDTWEAKQITCAASPGPGTWDFTTGIGVRVRWTLMAGTTFQTTAGTWQTGDFHATSNQVNACDSTSNDFRITGVQLEVGPVATEFDSRTFNESLQLCMRYYEKSYAYADFPGAVTMNGLVYAVYSAAYVVAPMNIRFAAQKRAVPTVLGYTSTTGVAGSWVDTTAGVQTVSFNVSTVAIQYALLAAGTAGNYGHWTAIAEL